MSPGVATDLNLRVTVADTWAVCALRARANEALAAVKARALAAARIEPERAAEYAIKFGGALVGDERRSLADLGVPEGAALVVLAARRRAVR